MPDFAVSGSFTGTGTLNLDVPITKSKTVAGAFTGAGTVTFNTATLIFDRAIKGAFAGLADLALNPNYILIERSQVWWNPIWLYRRNLQINTGPVNIPTGHPITAYISRSIITQNKAKSNGADIFVLRLVSDVPETWEVQPARVEILDSTVKVQWANYVEIAAGVPLTKTYFIYYGNNDLVNLPVSVAAILPEWPIALSPSNTELAYTRPGEHWTNGVAETVGAKVTLSFYGSDVRVRANKNSVSGIAEVQIDDEPWTVVDLFNSVTVLNSTVFERRALPIGTHYLRYRVSGNANPSSSGTSINFTGFDYVMHANAISISEEANETLMWGSVIGGVVGG